MKRLRDLVITILGLWLVMSPRLLHFVPNHLNAVWNTWMVGVAVVLLVAVSRYLVDERTLGEDIISAVLGLWLMISPWVLGFADHSMERINSILVGSVVAVLALWAMVVDTDIRKWMEHWMHEHHMLR